MYGSNRMKKIVVFIINLHKMVVNLSCFSNKIALERIQELELLEESKKQTLYDLIDTYIRDFKTRKAFANVG